MTLRNMIYLVRSVIGDKMPIVICVALFGCLFIGIGILASSDNGYGVGKEVSRQPYIEYTNLNTCIYENGTDVCQERFETASELSKNIAMKYRTKQDCTDDYGDICSPNGSVWSPSITGIILRKDTDFVLPIYTSLNPKSSHYGYIFNAEGDIIGRYKSADGRQVALKDTFTRPLTNSILPAIPMTTSDTSSPAPSHIRVNFLEGTVERVFKPKPQLSVRQVNEYEFEQRLPPVKPRHKFRSKACIVTASKCLL